MLVSIVVPCSTVTEEKQLLNLQACLSYLHSQTYNSTEYEVIVVENPVKTDKVHRACKSLCFRHISSESGGNKARNAGISAAKGGIIALCDSDVMVNSNWIREIVKTFVDYNNIGVVGGTVELHYDTYKPRWLSGEFLKYLARVYYDVEEVTEITDLFNTMHIVSANCAFLKTVWEKSNGFPEDIDIEGSSFGANDEVEFFFRCAKDRKLLYNPNMIASHIITYDKVELNWFRKRFYCQGIADAQLAKRISKDTDIGNLYHDNLYYDANRLSLYNHDMNRHTRDSVCHEPSMREYIKNIIICRTDYMTAFQNEILGESHWCQNFR